ncbi:peptidoglycan-binding protein [Alkalimarinus coralli]|uniref:peptidoglycan-binding protein n=1 Tax=Alkalimarinus coralli TaxID=2935863 RepID=UPI00202AC442|nr:peptidoglycan-binding protein [Alkalimarinus coralli]
MKTRFIIQGMIYDIYPAGFDLSRIGKRLDFSSSSNLLNGFQSCQQFVEQLLHYNPGAAYQLSSGTFFQQQVSDIVQQLEAGELIAVQPDQQTEDSLHSSGSRLRSASISKEDITESTSIAGQQTSNNQARLTPKIKHHSSAQSPLTQKPTLNYQVAVEVAGQNLPRDQHLYLHKTEAEQAAQQFATNDRALMHRSEVRFRNISQQHRKVSLAINMKNGASPMLLPLIDNIAPSKGDRSKPEHDNVIIPIKPIHIETSHNSTSKTAPLSNGWLYLFWKGTLWRELEVLPNSAMCDCRVEWYRNQIRFDSQKASALRKAEGRWLNNIWIPYKIQNEFQLGRNGLRIAYSKTQWPWHRIQALESDTKNLIANTTSLDAIQQYSAQQHFDAASASISSLESAMNISPGSQGARGDNPNRIAAIYLEPQPNQLNLKLHDATHKVLAGKRYQLIAGDNIVEGVVSPDGTISHPMPYQATEGELRVWCDNESEVPSHKIPIKLEQLADINSTEGIQARLNNLNHSAGPVDGISGPKMLGAVRQFQQRHQLAVDGDPGPITQQKLKQIHGN